MKRTIVDKFVTQHKWSESTLMLAAETKFHCAYCDSYFFESIEHYYAFTVEHIVPPKHGGTNDLQNLTVACRTCNILKRTWNPYNYAPPNASRNELVAAARKYVLERREIKRKKVYLEKDDSISLFGE